MPASLRFAVKEAGFEGASLRSERWKFPKKLMTAKLQT